MFGINPGSNSGFIWRGRGEAWEQSSGYTWEWTGVHDKKHKKCEPKDDKPCPIPPEIDIEEKKNLARACIASIDNNYYYTKSWAGLIDRVYHESIQHNIDAVTYSG